MSPNAPMGGRLNELLVAQAGKRTRTGNLCANAGSSSVFCGFRQKATRQRHYGDYFTAHRWQAVSRSRGRKYWIVSRDGKPESKSFMDVVVRGNGADTTVASYGVVLIKISRQ